MKVNYISCIKYVNVVFLIFKMQIDSTGFIYFFRIKLLSFTNKKITSSSHFKNNQNKSISKFKTTTKLTHKIRQPNKKTIKPESPHLILHTGGPNITTNGHIHHKHQSLLRRRSGRAHARFVQNFCAPNSKSPAKIMNSYTVKLLLLTVFFYLLVNVMRVFYERLTSVQ